MASNPELEEIRKNQILDAALSSISEKGSANVTMEEIARAAGLSKGGLAHYYKSKHELFVAAFHAFFEHIFERSKQGMAQFPHPLDKLLCFQLLYERQDPDVYVGYPILFDLMGIASHDETFRDIFEQWVGNWIVLLRDALELGLEQGVFTGLDPDAMAKNISAIYQGVATRWFLAPRAHSDQWASNAYRACIERLMEPHIVKPR